MTESAGAISPTVSKARANVYTSFMTTIDSFLRRGLDITASLIGLIFLAPFFLWIAMRMRRDSPGPVFYRGPRVGLNGKNFGILKFRTMYEKPESYQGSRVTGKGDPRITAYGAWLRNTKINELPQLWNVLVGDMSLVGPRPEDPDIAQAWPEATRNEILSVRPGITSPATILYRDEETQLQNQHSVLDDYLRNIMPSKLRLDTLYIKNRTILTDLDIVFWTVIVLLPYMKRIPIPERRLYWGPVANFTSRYVVWFIRDALITFLAIALTGLLWRTGGPLDIGFSVSVWLACMIAIIFSIINAIFGLSEVEWHRAPASDVIGLGLSAFIATIIVIYPFKLVASRFDFLPDGLVIIAALLSLMGFIAIRYKDRLITGIASRWLSARNGAGAIGERILLIGAGDNSKVATWFLQQSKLARAFSVVGILDDDPRKVGLRYEGHRVLGTTRQIPKLTKKYDIGIILFTITNISHEDRKRILAACRQTETLVVVLPDMLQTLQDSFFVANTMSEDDLSTIRVEDNCHLLEELDGLAQAREWDQLTKRLSELHVHSKARRSPEYNQNTDCE
jgi:lipopolysaccharide/colanic/teichoic acid biosynthesis glycosyltransferase